MSTYPRGFIRDNAGVMVPPGQVRRQIEETFLLGTMGSWLTLNSGTQTFSGLSSSRCYTQVQTGAVSGNGAQISAPGISLASVEGILWEVNGLAFSAASSPFDITLGINAAGQVGAYASQASGATAFSLNSGAAAATTTNFNVRDQGEGLLRHNLGLLVLPQTKEVLLMQDQQAVAYRDCAASWNYGTATPNVSITTRTATAYSMQIEHLRLTVWTN